ncbi:uroporphyrinogen-III synthase-like, partial [Saccoglossus kowalevskii]
VLPGSKKQFTLHGSGLNSFRLVTLKTLNIRVLLLRAPRVGPESDPYHQVFLNHGLEAASIPVLSFEFFALDDFYKTFKQPEKFTGIIFTSQRAVEATAMCMQQYAEAGFQQELMQKWSGLPAYVVGSATKTSADSLGFTCYGEDCGNAEELANVICTEVKPASKPLLFPCGTLKRETIPVTLESKHINYSTVEVYRTIADPCLENAIQDYKNEHGTPEFVVFFSPSGVRFATAALLKVYQSSKGTIKVC